MHWNSPTRQFQIDPFCLQWHIIHISKIERRCLFTTLADTWETAHWDTRTHLKPNDGYALETRDFSGYQPEHSESSGYQWQRYIMHWLWYSDRIWARTRSSTLNRPNSGHQLSLHTQDAWWVSMLKSLMTRPYNKSRQSQLMRTVCQVQYSMHRNRARDRTQAAVNFNQMSFCLCRVTPVTHFHYTSVYTPALRVLPGLISRILGPLFQ